MERNVSIMLIETMNRMTGTTKPLGNGIPQFDYHRNAAGSYQDVLDAAEKGSLIACRKHTETNEANAAKFVAAAMKSIARSIPETKDKRWHTSMPTASKTVLGIDGEFEIESIAEEARVYIDVPGCDTKMVCGYSVGPKLHEMITINEAFGTDDIQRLIADMRAGRVKASSID